MPSIPRRHKTQEGEYRNMREWTQVFHIALDVIIAAAILGMLLVANGLRLDIAVAMENEMATTSVISEYRVAAFYTGVDVYPQDIVSLVLQTQGYPTVEVGYTSGSSVVWSVTNASTDYTATAITAAVNSDVMYSCTVVYDIGGAISAYQFTEV